MAVKNFKAAGVRDNGDANFTATSMDLDGEAVDAYAESDDTPGVECAFLFKQLDNAGTFKKVIPKGSKFRITQVDGYKTFGAGGAGDTVNVKKTGTTVLSGGAVTLNVADKARINFTAAGLDDAQLILSGDAGDTLDLEIVDGNAGATDLSCDVIVRCLRVV